MLQALRCGCSGNEVVSWQSFLRGADLPLRVDGVFGPRTTHCTKSWQRAHGLAVDGVVGAQTMRVAVAEGWALLEPVLEGGDSGVGARLRPLSWSQKAAIFGQFGFRPSPRSDNPERIEILGDWAPKHIVGVRVPKARGGREVIHVHRLMRVPLLSALESIAQAGLTDRILDWNGGWVARYKRGHAGEGPAALSAHAYGSAVDINARYNRMGCSPAPSGALGSVVELVPHFRRFGFAVSPRSDGSSGLYKVASSQSSAALQKRLPSSVAASPLLQ